MTSILIADDHAIVLGGLASLLDAEPGLTVTAVAAAGEEVLPAARRVRPDVALLDIRMPGELDGIGAAQLLARELPEIRVLIMTGLEGVPGQVRRARAAGAAGFLPKTAQPRAVVAAVHRVAKGGTAYDPELVGEAAAIGPSPLTAREHQVLLRLARGADAKRIARELGLSLGTVRNHQTALLAKLGEGTPLAAVRMAVANGWLPGI
ncbi:response regulator transcription factor [Streptomyces sp. HUAS MG91]|uniref:Response regulator transcription factor n=1 Tax=Streptomyces tabacisoli TaxID=3156398 RepID=A0AAU8IZ90_9ACTN